MAIATSRADRAASLTIAARAPASRPVRRRRTRRSIRIRLRQAGNPQGTDEEVADGRDEDGQQGPGDAGRQRLDKWLFFSRMAKSRSLAQDWITSGHVSVNGATQRQVPPRSAPVTGSSSGLPMATGLLVVRAPGVRRGPFDEARLLYEDLTPERPPKDRSAFEIATRDAGSGRRPSASGGSPTGFGSGPDENEPALRGAHAPSAYRRQGCRGAEKRFPGCPSAGCLFLPRSIKAGNSGGKIVIPTGSDGCGSVRAPEP